MGRSGEAFPDNAFIRREVEPPRDDAIDRAAAEFADANAGADRAVRLQTAEDVDDAAHPSIGEYRDTAVAAPADSGEEREVADYSQQYVPPVYQQTDTSGTFISGVDGAHYWLSHEERDAGAVVSHSAKQDTDTVRYDDTQYNAAVEQPRHDTSSQDHDSGRIADDHSSRQKTGTARPDYARHQHSEPDVDTGASHGSTERPPTSQHDLIPQARVDEAKRDQPPVDIEHTPQMRAINDAFTEVRLGLFDNSHPDVTLAESHELGGDRTVDAVTLVVAAEWMGLKGDEKQAESDTAIVPSDASGTGTELAESTARGEIVFGSLVDRPVQNTTSIRNEANRAIGSDIFRYKKAQALQEADRRTEDRLGARPANGRRSKRWDAANLADRRNAYDDLLGEARKHHDFSLDWFVEQTEQYEREGEAGLWASMDRQPDEKGRPRNLKVASLGWLKTEYDLNNPYSDGMVTRSNGEKMGRDQARSKLWKHRVYPLDQEYSSLHRDDPDAIIGPHTLERFMRIAALQGEHYFGGKHYFGQKPMKQSQDGHPVVDILQTKEGRYIEAIDHTLGLMKANFWNPAYQNKVRPTAMHADIVKLTALRMAYSYRTEVKYYGEVFAQQSLNKQEQAFNDELRIVEQAAIHSDTERLSNSLQGHLGQPTNEQLGRTADEIKAQAQYISQTQGPEKAQQYLLEQSIQTAGAIRGRAMVSGDFTAPNTDTVAGLPLDRLDLRTDQELLAMRQRIDGQMWEQGGQFGSSPPPHLLDMSHRLDATIAERDARARGGFGAIGERADALAADAVQRERENRHPAELTMHVDVGTDGSANTLAGLVAVLGRDVVTEFSTEGNSLSDGVRRVSKLLSRRDSSGNLTAKPTDYPQQEDPTPRNVTYGMRAAEGSKPPVSIRQHPGHILEQLSPEGIAVIPVRGVIPVEGVIPIGPETTGWSLTAAKIQRLANPDLLVKEDPQVSPDRRYEGRFSVELVVSGDMRFPSGDSRSHPPQFVGGQDKYALVITPLKRVGDRLIPNNTIRGILERQQRSRALTS